MALRSGTSGETSSLSVGYFLSLFCHSNWVSYIHIYCLSNLRFSCRGPFYATRICILFLGRLHPIKGADKLLQAFLQVQTQFPETVLVIAGPDEWGLEAKFRKLISRAGAGKRVIFPGMVSGNDKLDLLARADLFCLP